MGSEKASRRVVDSADRPGSHDEPAAGSAPDAQRPDLITTVKIVLVRAATLVGFWLLIFGTALAVVPMLGAYVYDNSGVGRHTPTSAQITFWLVPFLVLVVFVVVGELVAMRWLWRRGTVWISRLRAAAAEQAEQHEREDTTKDSKTGRIRGHASIGTTIDTYGRNGQKAGGAR